MATGDSTTLLYNNEFKIIYKDSSHRYYVDGKATPSVTTILGEVIAKPDLIQWPLNLALKELEEKLPNITKDDLNTARYAHVRKREHGANTGTAVHYLVEKRLNLPLGRFLDVEDVPQEVGLAVLAFEAWYRTAKPTVIATEKVVYSRKHGYVGTYDSILQIDGKTYLCDLKTSNAGRSAPKGIYAEHYVQLGAYYEAYEEQRQYEINTVGKSELVKIDDLMVISAKKDGIVDTQTLSSLDMTPQEAASLWRNAHHMYVVLSELKKQIGGKP